MMKKNNFPSKSLSKILSDVMFHIKNEDVDAALKGLHIAEKRLLIGNEPSVTAYSLIDELKKILKERYDSLHYEFVDFEKGLRGQQNPLILLINPSHSHEREIEFWTSFCQQAKLNNYTVIDLAFRKAEKFPASRMITHPARMIDLSRYLNDYATLSLPDWISLEEIDLYVDWEHRRWQLDCYSPKVSLGCMNTVKYIDHIITSLKPAAVLTTNKIDPPNYFAYLAALNYGIEYRFLERSPLDSYLMEKSGMFSESTMIEDVVYDLANNNEQNEGYDNQVSGILNKILENPYGFRASEASKEKWENNKTQKGKIYFLPLDNLLWTGWAQINHPQGNIDYPVFRSPEEALILLDKHIKDLGGQLIVKPHPSCKEWRRLSNLLPEIEFSNLDLNELCSVADVIISFLTKVSFLGLAKKKPVVSFGGGLLDNLGVTYQVKSASELRGKLKSASAGDDLIKRYNTFKRLLPKLNDRYFESGKLAFDSLSRNISTECQAKDEAEINKDIDACLDTETLRKKVNFGMRSKGKREDENVVIFDVSRLLNSNLSFSGISRYTEAVAKNITKDPRLNVLFCYTPSHNEHGMSGYYFSDVERKLEAKLLTMEEALSTADRISEKYIFHSPVNPLPDKTDHPNMLRVITIHDIFHLTHKHLYDSNKFITGKIIQSIEDKDGLLFVSDFSRKEFSKYTNRELNNTSVTHLAADTIFTNRRLLECVEFLTQIDSDTELLCFPYQNDSRKGFDRMIGLASKWLEDHEDRMVVIFGGAKNEVIVEQLISSMNPKFIKKMKYLSNLSDMQLSVLYSRCLAQLYLSEAEGFGLPPLEAMACGCPSIMLNNTALAEVYSGWPFLLRSECSDVEILDCLNQITSKQKQLSNKEIRYSAQKFALNFSWSETVSKTVDFYLANLNSDKCEKGQSIS